MASLAQNSRVRGSRGFFSMQILRHGVLALAHVPMPTNYEASTSPHCTLIAMSTSAMAHPWLATKRLGQSVPFPGIGQSASSRQTLA